jgi:hypothetical protein
MIDRKISLLVLVTLLLTGCSDDAPVEVEGGVRYTGNSSCSGEGCYEDYIQITALLDSVVINEVQVNRGNCKAGHQVLADSITEGVSPSDNPVMAGFAAFFGAVINGPPVEFPVTLQYGKTLDFQWNKAFGGCNVREVDVKTDERAWTFNFQ